jgi:hypothetical protein
MNHGFTPAQKGQYQPGNTGLPGWYFIVQID